MWEFILSDEMALMRTILKEFTERAKGTKEYAINNKHVSKLPFFKKWADKDEAIANLELAHRQIEYATMLFWKVIQADAWGVSIYDKPSK